MSTATASRPKAGKPIVGKARMLHTMIRVLDLEKSIDFYTRYLGMTLCRRSDNETGRYTVAFVGYGDENEATVVELTPGGPRLLRAGAVPRSALEELLGQVPDGAPTGAIAASPGQQKRHYAPAALVRLLDASALPRIAADLPGPVGALVRSDIALPPEVVSVRLPPDPAGYARDLYAALRDLEDRGCTSICVESVPASPEWDAIRDRLARAAA